MKIREFISYLVNKDTGGGSGYTSEAVKINPKTNLPSVADTLAKTEWIAESPTRSAAGSTESWIQSSAWTAPPRDSGHSGHPGGAAHRAHPQQYRRGWLTRNAEQPPPQPTLRREPPPRQERPFYQPPIDTGGSGSGGGYEERPYQAWPGSD